VLVAGRGLSTRGMETRKGPRFWNGFDGVHDDQGQSGATITAVALSDDLGFEKWPCHLNLERPWTTVEVSDPVRWGIPY